MQFLEHIAINPDVKLIKGNIYPFIDMASVSTKSREPDYIGEKVFTSGIKFQKGDTIIARIEPCLQNGKRFYCKNIEKGFGSTEYLVFRPKDEKINNLYLYYFMQQNFIKQAMINSMSGATGRQRVNNNVFNNFEISLPPLEIQEKIAGILSAYDDLIENNKKQIKLLEEAAQRLYKEWFVNFNFPGHEDVKFIDGLPEGWRKILLSDIADVVMGQSPKSEFYNKLNNGLPFHQGVGSYGERFVKDYIYSTSYTKIAKEGSILFSVRAPVGRLNITKNKIVIGRGLSAINHKKNWQSYLFYSLKHKFFREDIIGNGAIFASISKDELLKQDFIVATDNLAEEFNNVASKIDRKIEILDEQNKFLSEARDRLLPKLMSGEISNF